MLVLLQEPSLGTKPGLKQSRGMSVIFILELTMAFFFVIVNIIMCFLGPSFSLSFCLENKSSVFCRSSFGTVPNLRTRSLKTRSLPPPPARRWFLKGSDELCHTRGPRRVQRFRKRNVLSETDCYELCQRRPGAFLLVFQVWPRVVPSIVCRV